MVDVGLQAASAFGIGLALSAAPGPVQVVIVSEAARGGMSRGFRALLGAGTTFAALLAAVVAGVAVAPPRGAALHVLRIAGGGLLMWLAWEGAHAGDSDGRPGHHRPVPPLVAGALSVVVNPGAWLFLGVVAMPLLAAAASGGTGLAFITALVMAIGAAAGDSLIVLAGGIGLPRLEESTRRRTILLLHLLLGGLGAYMLLTGVRGWMTG